MKKVAVIMGSDSDLPVVESAISTLAAYGVECEAHIYSAHRTPDEAKAFAKGARNAALLAIQILAVEDGELAAKLQDDRDRARLAILEKDARLGGR